MPSPRLHHHPHHLPLTPHRRTRQEKSGTGGSPPARRCETSWSVQQIPSGWKSATIPELWKAAWMCRRGNKHFECGVIADWSACRPSPPSPCWKFTFNSFIFFQLPELINQGNEQVFLLVLTDRKSSITGPCGRRSSRWSTTGRTVIFSRNPRSRIVQILKRFLILVDASLKKNLFRLRTFPACDTL